MSRVQTNNRMLEAGLGKATPTSFRVIQAGGVIQCDKCDSLNVTTVDNAASQE